MKRIFWMGALSVLLVGSHAWGDVASMMKQRARDMGNRPDRTGENPPPPPAKPAPPPAAEVPPPPASGLQPAHLEAAKVIQNELEAIKPKSRPTFDQRQKVTAAMEAAAQGPVKPEAAVVGRLAADLVNAWPNVKMSDAEKGSLAKNLVILLNGNSIPGVSSPNALQQCQMMLKYSGLPPEQLQKVSKDLTALHDALKK